MRWLMSFFFIGVMSLFNPVAEASERKVAQGTIESVDGKTGFFRLKNNDKEFRPSGRVVIQISGVEERMPLRPKMRVTLYSSGGDRITRIVVHGPYSFLKELRQH